MNNSFPHFLFICLVWVGSLITIIFLDKEVSFLGGVIFMSIISGALIGSALITFKKKK